MLVAMGPSTEISSVSQEDFKKWLFLPQKPPTIDCSFAGGGGLCVPPWHDRIVTDVALYNHSCSEFMRAEILCVQVTPTHLDSSLIVTVFPPPLPRWPLNLQSTWGDTDVWRIAKNPTTLFSAFWPVVSFYISHHLPMLNTEYNYII